jgi:cysteine desulfurase
VAQEQLDAQAERWHALRQALLAGLQAQIGPVQITGYPTDHLPNTLYLCNLVVIGEEVLAQVPQIAASTNSACHAGQVDPSPVLLAMGIEPSLALGALRLSLGRWTSYEDITQAVDLLSATILRLRADG